MSDAVAADQGSTEPDAMRSQRPFRVLLLAVIVLPFLLFSISSSLSYQTLNEGARGQLGRTLDAIHEHAAKVFETHELVFNQVDQMLGDMSDDEIRAHEAEIHNRLGT